jgi:hypothetical protein
MAKINIDAVTVRFLPRDGEEPSKRTYTYKALSVARYTVGEVCVVDVPRKGLSEVEIVSIADFDSLPPVAFEYKWIVAGCSLAQILDKQGENAALEASVGFHDVVLDDEIPF